MGLSIAEEKRGKSSLSQITTLAAGHFLADFYINILVSITPLLALSLNLTSAALGFMATATSLLSSFLQPYFGYVVDRRRLSWLLPVSIIWTGVGMSVIGILPNFCLLIIVTSLAGIGSAVYHPIGSQFTSTVSKGKAGAAMSIYSLGGNIGLTLSPLIVVPMVKYWGMGSMLYLIIPALLFILLVYRQRIMQIQPALSVPRSQEGKGTNLLEDAKKKRIILWLNLATAFRSWASTIVVVYVPTLYVLTGHSEVAGGRLLSLFFGAGVVGSLIGGYLADYISQRKIVLYTSFLSLLFMIGFFYSHGVLSWIMLAGAGAVLPVSIPVTVVMAQKLLPRNAAMASGLMMGFTFGLGNLGTILTGILGDFIGLSLAVKSMLLLLVVSSYFTWRLPEEEFR